MDNLTLGLEISLYGIGITFLVLAVVILLIKLILFLFPAKPAASPPAKPEEIPADPNIPHVVAFAAAWWLKQKKDPSLGERLEKPPGKWWHRSKE
jgi:hypothetical protein